MNKKPNTSIQMFADFEGDTSTLFNTQAPDEVPVLTTRNMVLFPGILVPILLGRKASINLAKKLDKSGNGMICAIFCQRNADIDSPKVADLYKIGVYARLVKMIEMPNIGNITAIFQALGRCELETITGYKPYYTGIVKPAPEHIPDDKEKNTDEYKTFMADLHTTTERLINVNDEIPSETMMPLKNMGDDTLLINFVCTNLPFSVRDKIKLLQIGDFRSPRSCSTARCSRMRSLTFSMP